MTPALSNLRRAFTMTDLVMPTRSAILLGGRKIIGCRTGRPCAYRVGAALSQVRRSQYIPFAAQHNFELHQIRGGRKTVDIYNIQRVNAFHSSLKRWIRKFNGVSTKFLTNYLFWYKWTQLFKTEIERNKPKKFFIHANSTHSISLIMKVWNIGRLGNIEKVGTYCQNQHS